MTHTDLPELSRLPRAAKAELLATWAANFGESPAFKGSREVLALALAWRLQERRYGGLKPAVQRKLGELAAAVRRKPAAPFAGLRPGTVILREWRGEQYRVTVLDQGFGYEGKTYQSLSEIAREITGTRWNGPAFFGLRKGSRRPAEVSGDDK